LGVVPGILVPVTDRGWSPPFGNRSVARRGWMFHFWQVWTGGRIPSCGPA